MSTQPAHPHSSTPCLSISKVPSAARFQNSRNLRRRVPRWLPWIPSILILLLIPDVARAQLTLNLIGNNANSVTEANLGRQVSFTLAILANNLSEDTQIVATLPPGANFQAVAAGFSATVSGSATTGEQVTVGLGEIAERSINNLLTIAIASSIPDGTFLQVSFQASGHLSGSTQIVFSNVVSTTFQAGYLPVSIFVSGYGAQSDGAVPNADGTFSNFKSISSTGSGTSGQVKSNLNGSAGGLAAMSNAATAALSVQMPGPTTPVKVGDITGPNSIVRLTGISSNATAYGGFALSPTDTGFSASPFFADADGSRGAVAVTISFSNPNAYSVPLIFDTRESLFAAAGNEEAIPFGFPGNSDTGFIVTPPAGTGACCGVETNSIFERVLQTPSGTTVRVAQSMSCFPEAQPVGSFCGPPTDTTTAQPGGGCVFGCSNIPPGGITNSLEFSGTDIQVQGNSHISTDAATGNVTLIRTGYGSASAGVSLRIYRGDANLSVLQQGEPAKLRFTSDPSVQLLVTDPQGRRVGFQAAPSPPSQFSSAQGSSSVLTELPGASYSGLQSSSQVIVIPDPQPGNYQVQVSASADPTFLLMTETLDINDRGIDNQSVSGALTAGGSSSFAFNVDEQGHVTMPGGTGTGTPPTTVASLSPQPNGAGWDNSNVTVTLTATAASAGATVKQITYSETGAQALASTTVNAPSVQILISTEGVTTLSFFATDNAGNAESPKSIAIRLDKTAPSINCGAPDGQWHATDVNISCAASDAGSGLANVSDATFSLSTSVPAGTETPNAATGTHPVCDVAGNCTSAGPIAGNMVDKKPPSINIASPSSGAAYLLNQAVNASYSCNDGGSGVATCSGTVVVGSPVDTASVGNKTFTVNATDKVGNAAAPQSVSYSVAYGVCVLYDPTRSVQSGSTIPLKVQLCDANNADVSNSLIVVHAVSLVQVSTNSSEVLQASGNANPDNDFRFDPTLGPTGGYIFNLSTKGLTTGAYLLTFMAAADPAPHTLPFQVR